MNSPKQDFTQWEITRLSQYSRDLDKTQQGVDRHIRKRVNAILSEKLQKSPTYQGDDLDDVYLPDKLHIPTREELMSMLNSGKKAASYDLPFKCIDEEGNTEFIKVRAIRESQKDYIARYRSSEGMREILGYSADSTDEKIWEKLSGGYDGFDTPIIQYECLEEVYDLPIRKYLLLPVKRKTFRKKGKNT